ncbi:MAG: LacI family transcriptional regulator [Lentisphaerae bacterium]|jgi:LacI family transcriptional regulator|nr:LacI family transcriptional regulator [Lentisphaerota bacterium]
MSMTLRQLADKINVAPSTVSRALSNNSGVSEVRAREIRQLADKLGYRPKPLRRSMNKTLGLLVSSDFPKEPDDTYQSNLIAAALEQVGRAGWHLHFEVIPRGNNHSKLVRENRVDGVLLCGFPSQKLCDELLKIRMPAVALDDLAMRTGLSSVVADVSFGTEQVVKRLRAMGHERIAMIATADAFPTVAARVDGYRRAIADLHQEDDLLAFAGYSTIQQGQIATRQLMERCERPTAFIYATDCLAVGGMIEFGRMGLRVPEDVSIAGHDNTSLARDMEPALTSVDLHLPRMIDVAVSMLREHIARDSDEVMEPLQKKIEVQTIWRNSCGPAPQSDS